MICYRPGHSLTGDITRFVKPLWTGRNGLSPGDSNIFDYKWKLVDFCQIICLFLFGTPSRNSISTFLYNESTWYSNISIYIYD